MATIAHVTQPTLDTTVRQVGRFQIYRIARPFQKSLFHTSFDFIGGDFHLE